MSDTAMARAIGRIEVKTYQTTPCDEPPGRPQLVASLGQHASITLDYRFG